MRRTTLITLLAPAAAVAPAIAQSRPATDTPAPAATQTADEIARRMFTNGSSLLQAQLETRGQRGVRGVTQQNGVIDASVSFFVVPEPEPTVLRRHDLITVIVREESSSKSTGRAAYEKEYELDAALKQYINLNLRELTIAGKRADEALELEAERGFGGDGSTDRRDTFVTRLTAEVIDVKPNGTLVLQARKRITVDEDGQELVLTGIVRTKDVTAANTVLSSQLHDLRLEKRTVGPVRDATKRGFLPRFVDRVNPF
jgi:flagellar L-ring protein precursor FlgH